MKKPLTPSEIALNRSLSEIKGEIHHGEGGELWYQIERTDRMAPFLMSLVSDRDHWLYLLSNGSLTAGRGNPDRALFPYYTQDKLLDLTASTGGRSYIRIEQEDGTELLWEPYRHSVAPEPEIERRIRKNHLGNHIILEETHLGHELTLQTGWRPSASFGFVRRQQIRNTGSSAVTLRLLDGFVNLVPHGLEQRFQNEFSILGDAYKQCELEPEARIGVYHLSSVPTDLALPMASLRASVAWQTGLADSTCLLSEAQVRPFCEGLPILGETASRGRRGAYLNATRIVLEPGEEASWYTCGDVARDAAEIESLRAEILASKDLPGRIEADCAQTERRLKEMLSGADGFQCTGLPRQTLRHTSNTVFNLMRGGALVTGYALPKEDLLKTVAHFNHEAADSLATLIEEEELTLTCEDSWDPEHPLAKGNPDALRLVREYLPLSFSRRHGDPSRPWNHFDIVIREADGSPRFAYQGNWRDIFQNWEALLHSWPEYLEAAISRFLNASTADGYNPYRLTKDGYEWETLDPDDPWANIGYWGDHQIIYLLRLLEASARFHPGKLQRLLAEDTFVYAEIPYRIRSYHQILENPRETIDYDEAWEARIATRVEKTGADGKLMPDKTGAPLTVALIEKLLNPLIAKLSNFIPDGGIWMNTQRPEWNDANNALVGFGVSVVTLGYVNRYLTFLLEEFGHCLEDASYSVSRELADLLEAQAGIFTEAPQAPSPESRMTLMDTLGESASAYREALYKTGLSGEKRNLPGRRIRQYLEAAQAHVSDSLRHNRRPDGLWHSYNLLVLKGDNREAHLKPLVVMLEGQVSILSSGVLQPEEILSLLRALRESDLYRPDQDSYTLYPDKVLPGFLDKNRVSSEAVLEIPLLRRLLEAGDETLIKPRPDGGYAFNADYHNSSDLAEILDGPALSKAGFAVDNADREAVLNLFEHAFNHHAFTGRSGTFFAYEGLGSIYWHMVSKLVLAVQETLLSSSHELTRADRDEWMTHFRRLREGLGIEKSPEVYGAFPTDAYSHTPAHAGAQQPGMTGQVKEDILVRLAELGLRIIDGRISFAPELLSSDEFLEKPDVLSLVTIDGGHETIELPKGALAYTFCQVPVIYYRNAGMDDALRVTLKGGQVQTFSDGRLPAELSGPIFRRDGTVQRIEVNLT